jgi:hypothetical protein
LFKHTGRHVGDLEAGNDAAIADDGTEFLASLLRPGAQLFLPEISLVAAMFEDAVRCVRRARPGVTNREWLEAFEWIASERHDWPFAFVNVCDFLGLDSSGVRARLGVWPERFGARSHAQYESLARPSW